VNWLVGLCLAGLIAGVAYRLRLLTVGGAWAAVGVGASVFGAGGLWASAPMVGFFFTSSLLPRLLGRPHKTERRTAVQALANGLAPALCCWGATLTPAYAEAFWLGYITALATATADTWATEFGVRFGSPVWLLTTGRRIAAGESGGVSWQGTLGGIAGACAIACLGAPLVREGQLLALAAGLGVAGMALDSLLGATLQARYWCALCNANRAGALLQHADATLARRARAGQQRGQRR
jgi:uncharacterized protein (TIGR00297 family)